MPRVDNCGTDDPTNVDILSTDSAYTTDLLVDVLPRYFLYDFFQYNKNLFFQIAIVFGWRLYCVFF